MIFQDWSPAARLWLFFPAVAALSLVRKLRLFTITNVMGIAFCLATCIYLTYFAAGELVLHGRKPAAMFQGGTDMVLWIGSCGYIFEMVSQVLPVYEAARDKETMPKLLVAVTASVLALYIAFGFLFYSAFGEATADLATLNIPSDSLAGTAVPLLFSLVGMVTMPLNCMVIFQTYEPQCAWSQNALVRKWSKNAARIFICLSCYALTWLGGEELQNFLALVGGLLGCNLALNVPALLHLVVCKPSGWRKAVDLVTFTIGTLIMVVSTYQSLATWK